MMLQLLIASGQLMKLMIFLIERCRFNIFFLFFVFCLAIITFLKITDSIL
jgi:hypothetical protein